MRVWGLNSTFPAWIRPFPRVLKEAHLERLQMSGVVSLNLLANWGSHTVSLCLFPRILSAAYLLEGDIQIRQYIERQYIHSVYSESSFLLALGAQRREPLVGFRSVKYFLKEMILGLHLKEGYPSDQGLAQLTHVYLDDMNGIQHRYCRETAWCYV